MAVIRRRPTRRLTWGATVYCTVGTDEKAQACLRIGADAAINYRNQDFVSEARRLTGNRGIDVVLDMVGGPYIERNLKLLAIEARLAQQLRTEIWPLLEQGRLLPVIYQVFPLEQAAAAHALMESSEHIGKILLVP